MSDRIVLTIPRERPFHTVAHLVLGGLALRHNLTLEQLEDLQLALEALLEHDQGTGEVCLELQVDAEALAAELGPFAGDRLRAELERDPHDGSVGLARVLSTVVDDVELSERAGGTWIRLVKAVEGAHVPAEAS
ncbi:MAG TPA: hypothetical protein VFL66_13120 [Gaiellaceae bacterium]|nr:hypothetical protein [Gaiellaceae bacterium]